MNVMKITSILILALVPLQSVVADDNKTVAGFFNESTETLVSACESEGFKTLCPRIKEFLLYELNVFCREQSERNESGFEIEDLAACFKLPAEAYHTQPKAKPITRIGMGENLRE